MTWNLHAYKQISNPLEVEVSQNYLYGLESKIQQCIKMDNNTEDRNFFFGGVDTEAGCGQLFT